MSVNSKAAAVIILHGWNLSQKIYQPLITCLEQKHFQVHCFDLPGFGQARPLKAPLRLDDYAKFVEDYLKSKKINQAVIIGHSFGGRIGIKLAVSNPEIIQALVLTGVPIITLDKRKIRLFWVISKTGRLIFSLPLMGYLEKFAKKILYRAVGTWDYYRAEGIMKQTFLNTINEDLEFLPAKIKTPTLVIWGGEDMLVPPKTGQITAQKIQNARYIEIPGYGHGLPYQNPERFSRELMSFLNSIQLIN